MTKTAKSKSGQGDSFTMRERSKLMARIRNRNTQPELRVVYLLRGLQCLFTTHDKYLPGTPDIVLSQQKAVIFVHGCFWHRHACRKGRSMPSTNIDFWHKKFERNRQRDRQAKAKLRRMGWRHFTVWECQLKREEWLIDRIINFLES